MSQRPDSWTRRHPRGGRTRSGWIVLGNDALELYSSRGRWAARLCRMPLTPEIRARFARREDQEPEPTGELGITGCARVGWVDGRGRWVLAGSGRQVAP